MASLEWYWYVPCFPTQIKQKYEGSSCSTNSRWAIEAETSKVQLFSVIQARVLSTRDAVQISWWWPDKWLAVKVHLAGGGLELEPPSTTFHYLPPRRVRTLVPCFPASDDSGIMLSNTHRASEIQTNRGILANWQIEEQGVELPSLQMKNCKFIFCLSQVTFSFFLKLRFWRILCYGSSTSEQSETVITLHCTQLRSAAGFAKAKYPFIRVLKHYSLPFKCTH